MSRSRRKTPMGGMAKAESEKEFKRQEHQRERANVRSGEIDDVNSKAFGNPWAGPKDGKRYWGSVDPEYLAKLMRK